MSGCPFDVGDVVVCVDIGPVPCGALRHTNKHLSVGGTYRVLRVGMGIHHGVACGHFGIEYAPGKYGVTSRFRKIDADVTDEFRHALRSIKQRTPVSA